MATLFLEIPNEMAHEGIKDGKESAVMSGNDRVTFELEERSTTPQCLVDAFSKFDRNIDCWDG